MNDFIFFVKEGIFHVLNWNAYDHVLFLVALAVIYNFYNWKKLIWLVTLFTIGHTVSLVFAAYRIVLVNHKIIEFLIPLTILITAIVTIFYVKNTSKQIKRNTNLFFALFFGLIHGFGFSSYFTMLVGSKKNKLLPLLEFSLGVEISQIIIVIVVLLFGVIMQSVFKISKRDWILVVSSIIIGLILPILKNNFLW